MATTFFVDSPADALATAAVPTHLHWRDASGQVRTQPLAVGATTVGGGPRCAVRVEGDGVRPLHCVIQNGDAGVTIRRWSAGTDLNGKPFTEAPLRIGDRLKVAGIELWTELPREAADTPDEEQIADAGEMNASTSERAQEAEEKHAAPTPVEEVDVQPAEPEVLPTDAEVEPPAAIPTRGATGPPVPAHLLQPWLNAHPELAADPESTPEPRAATVGVNSFATEVSPATQTAHDTSTDGKTERRDDHPTDTATSSEPQLRRSLRNARRRAKAVLATLRAERSKADQASARHDLAVSSRDELATKLLVTTTELHDCRSDLAEARTELRAACVERDDHRRLYDLAKEEIDELESRVENLLAEQAALVDEQSRWSEQREQLEAAIVALEARIGSESSPPTEATDSTNDTEEVNAASEDTVADSAVEEQPTDRIDDALDTSTPPADSETPFDWGVASTLPSTPTESSLPTDVEPSAEVTPDDPWAGVWSVEQAAESTVNNSPAEESPAAEPVAESAASNPEETAVDSEEDAAEAWLASFAAHPPQENNPTPTSETPIVDEVAEPPNSVPTPDEAPNAGDCGAELSDPPSLESTDQAAVEASEVFENDDAPKEASPVEALAPVEETESTPETAGSFLEQAGILAPGALQEVLAESPQVDVDDSVGGEESQAVESIPTVDNNPIADLVATPTPESVEDLIADDQPSSEAPVSFLDQFAGDLSADEPAALSGVAEPPTPETPAFAAPVEVAPAEDGEESIEDYMAKLMQRMRGDEESSAPIAAAAPTPQPAPSVPTPVAPPTPAEPDPAPQPAAPLASLDELRSGPAAEREHDMSSLRALANETARDAIGVAQVKVNKEKAIANLTISLMAMGCGGFLAATAPSWVSGQLFGGVAAFGWSAFWFLKTLRLVTARTKQAPVASAVATELPIGPPKQD